MGHHGRVYYWWEYFSEFIDFSAVLTINRQQTNYSVQIILRNGCNQCQCMIGWCSFCHFRLWSHTSPHRENKVFFLLVVSHGPYQVCGKVNELSRDVLLPRKGDKVLRGCYLVKISLGLDVWNWNSRQFFPTWPDHRSLRRAVVRAADRMDSLFIPKLVEI